MKMRRKKSPSDVSGRSKTPPTSPAFFPCDSPTKTRPQAQNAMAFTHRISHHTIPHHESRIARPIPSAAHPLVRRLRAANLPLPASRRLHGVPAPVTNPTATAYLSISTHCLALFTRQLAAAPFLCSMQS
ncbi:hypothetical protein B0I35DRAFT_55734 [Stachybotrys elegans]|uniref:Uncharacterized protein n=1 Tax=Stachybotrys elegans TaxID=80388 RepID=A0A8K0SM84_9HYPO|nr:hypothetical protein B0I35DRAFT_55734 [Stachybotrys elegans]